MNLCFCFVIMICSEKEEDLERKYEQLNAELRRILAKDGKIIIIIFNVFDLFLAFHLIQNGDDGVIKFKLVMRKKKKKL